MCDMHYSSYNWISNCLNKQLEVSLGSNFSFSSSSIWWIYGGTLLFCFYYFFMYLLNTQMYAAMPSNTNKHKALLTANTVATEAISNIRTVASYVNETAMINKYTHELLKPREKAFRQAIVLGILVGFGQFATMSVNALGICFCCVFVCWLVC